MTGQLTVSAEVKAYPLHSNRDVVVKIGSRAGACDVPGQLLFVVEQVVLSIGGERDSVIFPILVCNDLSFNKPETFQLQRRQFVKLTLIFIFKNVMLGNSRWRERGMFEYCHKQQLLGQAKRI